MQFAEAQQKDCPECRTCSLAEAQQRSWRRHIVILLKRQCLVLNAFRHFPTFFSVKVAALRSSTIAGRLKRFPETGEDAGKVWENMHEFHHNQYLSKNSAEEKFSRDSKCPWDQKPAVSFSSESTRQPRFLLSYKVTW